MTRPALLALLGGCTAWSRTAMQTDYRQLQADIAAAQVDRWAEICAPRELALALSHRDFTELEFRQGDPRRASQHLDVATENIRIALLRAELCRPDDTDKDRIFDDVDQCIHDPEDYDGYKDQDGCPDLDRDGDGLMDDVDQCPDDPEDKDGFQDEDGCPDPDNDKDGIPDVRDRCPNDPEDFNGIQDEDGCPERDTDGDGIMDPVDQCPTEPETKNDYLDEDGCPDVKPSNVRVTKEKIEIGQKIFFEYNKAVIKPVSYGILNEVAQVLKDYPHLTIRVEGHTDSDGSDAYNMTLSQARAESVMQYLISQGIDGGRLVAQGFGETRPIDTNRTNDGKANNRRVEFMITSGM